MFFCQPGVHANLGLEGGKVRGANTALTGEIWRRTIFYVRPTLVIQKMGSQSLSVVGSPGAPKASAIYRDRSMVFAYSIILFLMYYIKYQEWIIRIGNYCKVLA